MIRKNTKKKARSIEMVTGSLWKNIFLFSIPLMCSQLLEVMFNLSDVAVVGHFADYKALGAVGSTTLLVTLFTGFLIGMGSGVNVRVAHALFRTGSAQTGLLHSGQMIPASASGLRQYAFRYSRGWRTAYGDADPAYRREGHSLPGPAGRPVWPPWKWPFFSGRALLQNPPPAQWVTGRRVLVNSAGE